LKAAIVGISGLALTGAEAAGLKQAAGVILFRRNIVDRAQLAALMAELRAALPAEALLLVDQEGGRVARLRPPDWRAHPPAGEIGALHARDAASGLRTAWLTGALIGLDCAAAGFDVVCAPVLDVSHPGAHDVIGDRGYGADAETVAALGRACAEGLMAAGVQPVGKHAPGHGRAMADSHLDLPRIAAADLSADFLPFARNADLPWLMTAHILYQQLDPALPATLSPGIIEGTIRGRIGFQGVLVTDDLTMRALAGAPGALARAAIAAGCDLALHCSGEPAASEEVLRAVPKISDAAQARLAASRALARAKRQELDAGMLAAERDRLLG
jgi:beta-N-acetylhexosaminidase